MGLQGRIIRHTMTDQGESVVSSFALLDKISSYLGANDISSCAAVNKKFYEVCSRDILWEGLCTTYGFKSLSSSTRTRGKKSFKTIYLSALCIECRSVEGSRGSVVIDTNGGSQTRMGGVDGPGNSLIALCIECFQSVQQYTKHGERLRFALPNSKRRLPYHVWTTVLGKIPSQHKPSTSRRAPSQASASSSSTSISSTVIAGGNDSATVTGGGGQGARKRARDRYEDPEHNNYLLKQLRRKAS
jgi:hypothetical protein